MEENLFQGLKLIRLYGLIEGKVFALNAVRSMFSKPVPILFVYADWRNNLLHLNQLDGRALLVTVPSHGNSTTRKNPVIWN